MLMVCDLQHQTLKEYYEYIFVYFFIIALTFVSERSKAIFLPNSDYTIFILFI